MRNILNNEKLYQLKEMNFQSKFSLMCTFCLVCSLSDEITLVSSAKDWLSENYGQGDGANYAEEEAAKEDEVLQETFVAWRELYEAELAIELTK